jgi:serine/threonine protein kinase
MQELCCPSCGQRYSSSRKTCPKDGDLLVAFIPVTREISNAKTTDFSKTIQELSPKEGLKLRNLSMHLVPGMSVGEYVLKSKLGVGGMGEVWKAQQPTIGKTVAIKVLTQESAMSKKNIARFVQEARAVNEIRHPNLVDIFSFGELSDNRPYFVMEFLDGKSLSDYMQEKGPLPFADVYRIFSQVCEVLQAAHDKGIVHRDLKPDNIYLIPRQTETLFVKVLDFGIAKLAGEGAQNLTDQGSIFGTPGYMSPEQYEETKNVDHRSDLYALGVLLFEMLTGQVPFEEPGLGMYELIIRQMSQPPPKPSQVIAGRKIPEAVDALILRLLAKKPVDRPSSCKETLQLFKEAVASVRSETRVGQTQAKSPKAPEPKTMELSAPAMDNNALNAPTEVLLSGPSVAEMATIKQKLSPQLLATKVPALSSPNPSPTIPDRVLAPKVPSQTSLIIAVGIGILLLSAALTFLFMR